MADKRKKKTKKPIKKRVKKMSSVVDKPVLPVTYTQYRKGCCVSDEAPPINLTAKLIDLLAKSQTTIPKKTTMKDIFSQTEKPMVQDFSIQTEASTTPFKKPKIIILPEKRPTPSEIEFVLEEDRPISPPIDFGVEIEDIETEEVEPKKKSSKKQTTKQLINDLITYGKEPQYREFSKEEAKNFIKQERAILDLSADEFRKLYINMPEKGRTQREITKTKVQEYDKLFQERQPETFTLEQPKKTMIDNLGNIIS